MTAVSLQASPSRLAGFSLGAWGFTLRNWVATLLALYVAFWLQLDGASSAGTCVAILSLQTRGQVLQKAAYRMLGTVVGVVVSVAIAGAFSQTRDLFFLACCTWLGLCATLAGLLEGNRAYGAVLSGYTVAIVALPNVDRPLSTFSSGVNQGAAIAVGILSVAFVSDLFWAPSLYPTVLAKLDSAHGRARSFAVAALRTGAADPGAAAALFRQVTALHPDVAALPAESLRGRARFRAASLASAGILRVVSAAHVVSAALAALGAEGEASRADLVGALEHGTDGDVRQRALEVLATDEAPACRLVAASACLVLLEQHRQAAAALADLRADRQPAQRPHLALYRSRPAAVRNGLRGALALAISALILSLLSWPSAVTALVQVAILIGLSATNPAPGAFAKSALVALPLAVVATGVTEFLVLDGVDQFPLLALGMGPTIVVASLLLSAGKPALYGVGFLLIVFFPVILSPANPQSYNPQSYLFTSFLSLLAVVALFLLLATLLPTSAAQQGEWMLASARDDLREAVSGRRRRFDPAANAFRDADRIGQFSILRGVGAHESALLRLMRMSELAACGRRIRTALGSDRALRAGFGQARAALAALDPGRLRQLGRAMLLASHDGSGRRHDAGRRAAVDLLLAATLVERSPDVVAELRGSASR